MAGATSRKGIRAVLVVLALFLGVTTTVTAGADPAPKANVSDSNGSNNSSHAALTTSVQPRGGYESCTSFSLWVQHPPAVVAEGGTLAGRLDGHCC